MVRISKNTKVQIFYDRKYMAFDLFIYSAYNVFKNLFNDVCFIDNFDKLENNSTTVLIMYINDLGKYVQKFGFAIKNNGTKWIWATYTSNALDYNKVYFINPQQSDLNPEY